MEFVGRITDWLADWAGAIIWSGLVHLDQPFAGRAARDIQREHRTEVGSVELVFHDVRLNGAGVHGDHRIFVGSGLYVDQKRHASGSVVALG